MGIRFPLFGTDSSYLWGQRGRGLGEEKHRFPQLTEKRGGGSGGGIPPAPGVAISVRISVCQLLHDPIGGGVRKNLKLGEGVVTPSRGSGGQEEPQTGGGAKRSYFLLPTFLW